MLEKLKKLFFKKSKEEVVELQQPEEEKPQTIVKIEKLESILDVDKIERDAKAGHIILVKAKEIQRRDPSEFQASVQKIQRLARNYGWDVVGTEEGYLLVAPRSAKIVRE